MILARRDLVSVVEAAYQIELDEDRWLDGLAGVLGKMRAGEPGLVVYVYDASHVDRGVDISNYALRGLGDDFAEGLIVHNKHTPPGDSREVYHRGIYCGTVSEVLAPQKILPLDHQSFAHLHESYADAQDAWGLSASGPCGRGLGIAAPLHDVRSMSEEMRELWALVGVHLATAYRLRCNIADAERDAEAILDPGGKVVHIDGAGPVEQHRDELEDAVRRIDRARSQALREEASEALPLWRGLVEGRWSLVDREDTDGRRYVVAHPNDPIFDEPAILTQRERQVVAYAAQGDSDARIAYSLGLTVDTVAALLQSAQHKLGVDTRQALIDVLRSLSE